MTDNSPQTTDLPNDTMDLTDLYRIFNAPNMCAHSPLIDEARLGHAEQVKKMLENGADMYATTCAGRFGQTAAEVAIPRGHVKVLCALIDAGYDVNRLSACGETLLGIAARNGQTEIAKTLIKAGAEVNKPDAQGRPPLFESAQAGKAEVSETLIEAGADIHFQTKRETPLICAIQKNQFNVVAVLKKYGVDINGANGFGETPLMIATRKGNKKMIGLLLEHGADVNAVNSVGETALFYVNDISLKDLDFSYCGGYSYLQRVESVYLNHVQKQIAFQLCAYGADVNRQDKAGNTVLSQALQCGNVDLSRFLIQHGAQIDFQNNVGHLILGMVDFRLKSTLSEALSQNKRIPSHKIVSAKNKLPIQTPQKTKSEN